MTDGYVQQPGSSTDVRVDGKRVAGKMSFNPPGSGGSRPEMAERDLDFIPEVEGGKEAQPAGHHQHDNTAPVPLLEKELLSLTVMRKLQARLGMVMM